MSNTTIVMMGTGGVVTYSESILTRNASGNFQMTSYSDGALTKDADTGVKYVDNTRIQQQIDQVKTDLLKEEPMKLRPGSVKLLDVLLLHSGSVQFLRW